MNLMVKGNVTIRLINLGFSLAIIRAAKSRHEVIFPSWAIVPRLYIIIHCDEDDDNKIIQKHDRHVIVTESMHNLRNYQLSGKH